MKEGERAVDGGFVSTKKGEEWLLLVIMLVCKFFSHSISAIFSTSVLCSSPSTSVSSLFIDTGGNHCMQRWVTSCSNVLVAMTL